jgi:hydrogenase nickel incorporation protein HypA/HybF
VRHFAIFEDGIVDESAPHSMHEHSIVRALLDRACEQAASHGATRVHRLTVRLGALAGVEPELLASAYELFREGTLCRGAELELVTVPARWECRSCAREIPPGAPLRCPEHGEPARLVSGEEILLERMELEVPDV